MYINDDDYWTREFIIKRQLNEPNFSVHVSSMVQILDIILNENLIEEILSYYCGRKLQASRQGYFSLVS